MRPVFLALLILTADVASLGTATAQTVPTPPEPPAAPELWLTLSEVACPARIVESAGPTDSGDADAAWALDTHPRSRDGCIARFGDGLYKQGWDRAFVPAPLALEGLAGQAVPPVVINEAGLDSSALPTAAPAELAASARRYCRTNALAGATNPLVDPWCAPLVLAAAAGVRQLEVPAAGSAALRLVLEHAWSFPAPDDRGLAAAGGRVEVRRPDGDWEVLRPTAVSGVTGEAAFACPGGDETASGLLKARFGTLVKPGETLATAEGTLTGAGTEEDQQGGGDFVTRFLDAVRDPVPSSSDLFAAGARSCADVADGRAGAEPQHEGPVAIGVGYTGAIERVGAGFVGSSDVDGDGSPDMVASVFDLSPYAGLVLDVRLRAVGGVGVGTVPGGWSVDTLRVEYNGPPLDLRTRFLSPFDGASYPPGDVPFEIEVRNLGRLPSPPATLRLQAPGVPAHDASIPALAPLEARIVRTALPMPAGLHDVEAALMADTDDAGDDAAFAPVDAFPLNDRALRSIVVEPDDGVAVRASIQAMEGRTASILAEVSNLGNRPVTVQLRGELAPLDPLLRHPRGTDATVLGTLATVAAPHGMDINPQGAPVPIGRALFNLTFPETGVWEVTVTPEGVAGTPGKVVAVVDGSVSAPLDDAFPRIVGNQTGYRGLLQTPEGSYEAFPRHAAGGPFTLHIPEGDTAWATWGADVRDDSLATLSLNLTSNAEEVRNIFRAADRAWRGDQSWRQMLNDTGIPLTRSVGDLTKNALDTVTGPCPAEPNFLRPDCTLRLLEQGTQSVRFDAVAAPTVQPYHVRQHHVLSWTSKDPLPKDQGELLLEFLHAADVNWTAGLGTRARVWVVPGDTRTNEAVNEIRAEANATAAQFPPPLREVVEDVVFSLLFDDVVKTLDQVVTQVLPTPCQAYEGLVVDLGPAGLGGVTLRPDDVVDCPVRNVVGLVRGESGSLLSADGGEFLRNPEVPEIDTEGRAMAASQTRPALLLLEGPVDWRRERLNITHLAGKNFSVVLDLESVVDVRETVPSAVVDPNVADVGALVFEQRIGRSAAKANLPLWTLDAARIVVRTPGQTVRLMDLCDSERCREADPDGRVPVSANAGWAFLRGIDHSAFTFEPDAGRPGGSTPGAMKYERGPPQATDGTTWDTWGVLRLPELRLTGMGKPGLEVVAKWDMGPLFDAITTVPLDGGCDNYTRSAPVLAKAGWLVRVDPVDGTEGPTPVAPVDGYPACGTQAAPVQLNATLEDIDAPNLDLAAPSGSLPRNPYCKTTDNYYADPTSACRSFRSSWGDRTPILADRSEWTTLRFDLSEFKDRLVRVEIHAITLNGIKDPDLNDRNRTLTIDELRVVDLAPPKAVGAEAAEPGRAVAPGIPTVPGVRIENRGETALQTVYLRRVVQDERGCLAGDPVVVQRAVNDPETGAVGLPPGKTAEVRDARLEWAAPDDEGRFLRETVTADTAPMTLVTPASIDVGAFPAYAATINTTASNPLACRDDLRLHATTYFDRATVELQTGTTTVDLRQGTDFLDLRADTCALALTGACEGPGLVPGHRTVVAIMRPAPGTDHPLGPDLKGSTAVHAEPLTSAPDATVLVRVATPANVTWSLLHGFGKANAITTGIGPRTLVFNGVPEGRYVGLLIGQRPDNPHAERLSVRLPDRTYHRWTVDVPLLPPKGADLVAVDNLVDATVQVRRVEAARVEDLALPAESGRTLGDPVPIEVTIANTGNVPLQGVRASVAGSTWGEQGVSDPIPLLPPGDRQTVRVRFTPSADGATNLLVRASSGSALLDEVAVPTRFFTRTIVRTTDTLPAPWTAGPDGITARAVPPETRSRLPIQGVLDLRTSADAFVSLNATTDLEEGFDALFVELERDGETSAAPVGIPITSSHAGATASPVRPKGLSGASGAPVQRAVPTGILAPYREITRVPLDSPLWRLTSLSLDPPDGGSGAAAYHLGVDDEAVTSASFSLAPTTWCRIADAVLDGEQTALLKVWERRLFPGQLREPRRDELARDLETASVLLRMHVARAGSDETSEVVLPAVALDLADAGYTGWVVTTYRIDLAPFSPFVGDGQPLSDTDQPRDCATLLAPPPGFVAPTGSTSFLTFRVESPQLEGSLAVGWFLGKAVLRVADEEIDVLDAATPPADIGCGASAPETFPSRFGCPQHRLTHVADVAASTAFANLFSPASQWVQHGPDRLAVEAPTKGTMVQAMHPLDLRGLTGCGVVLVRFGPGATLQQGAAFQAAVNHIEPPGDTALNEDMLIEARGTPLREVDGTDDLSRCGEAFRTRASTWTDRCDPDFPGESAEAGPWTGSTRQAFTPLNGTRDRIAGPTGHLDAVHVSAPPTPICFDVTPYAGQVLNLLVRVWVPWRPQDVSASDRLDGHSFHTTAATAVAIQDIRVEGERHAPDVLTPSLLLATDDTATHGSITLHDVSLLEARLPLSVQAGSAVAPTLGPGTLPVPEELARDWPCDFLRGDLIGVRTRFTPDECGAILEGSTPTLQIPVVSRGAARLDDWELVVNVTETTAPDTFRARALRFGPDGPPSGVSVADTADGHVVTITWDALMEALGRSDPVVAEAGDVGRVDFFTNDAPGGTFTINYTLLPTRIAGLPSGCPTTYAELGTDRLARCRMFFDPVAGDQTGTIRLLHEALAPPPQATAIVPAQARTGAGPLDVALTVLNPGPRTHTLQGFLNITTAAGAPVTSVALSSTGVVLPPMGTTTTTVRFDVPKLPRPERLELRADLKDQPVIVRRTLYYLPDGGHETPTWLLDGTDARERAHIFFDGGGNSDLQDYTPAGASPALDGQPDSRLGFELVAVSGGDDATGATSRGPGDTDGFVLGPVDLRKVAAPDEGRFPVLTFIHQKRWSGNGGPNAPPSAALLVQWGPTQTGPWSGLGGWDGGPSQLIDFDVAGGDAQGQPPCATATLDLMTGSTSLGTPTPRFDAADPTAWVPVVVPLGVHLDEPLDAGPPTNAQVPFAERVFFRFILAACRVVGSAEVLIDRVTITSAAPLLVSADGHEGTVSFAARTDKRFQATLINEGLVGDAFRVAPNPAPPEGWSVRVTTPEGRVLYDSDKRVTTNTTTTVFTPEGTFFRNTTRVARFTDTAGMGPTATQPVDVRVRSAREGADYSFQLVAWPDAASGAMSGPSMAWALNATAPVAGTCRALDPWDEAEALPHRACRAILNTAAAARLATGNPPRPDLAITRVEISKDPEVGVPVPVAATVLNTGELTAEDARIVALVSGAGAHVLPPLEGEEAPVVSLPPGAQQTVRWSWTPTAPGPATLSVAADLDPDIEGVYLSGITAGFRGLIEERTECEPVTARCGNLHQSRVAVLPPQKPDFALTMRVTPTGELPLGAPVLVVTGITNGGGVAGNATLRLTANGLVSLIPGGSEIVGPIGPGEKVTRTYEWPAIVPGRVVLLGSVVASPDPQAEFAGRRADGSNALADNAVTVPLSVTTAGVSLELPPRLDVAPGVPGSVDAQLVLERAGSTTVTLSAGAGAVRLVPGVEGPVTVRSGSPASVPLLVWAPPGTPAGETVAVVTIRSGADEVQRFVKVTVARSDDVAVSAPPMSTPPGSATLALRVASFGNAPATVSLRTALPGGILSAPDVELGPGEERLVNATLWLPSAVAAGLLNVPLLATTDSGASFTSTAVVQVLPGAAALVSGADVVRLTRGEPAITTVTIENRGNRPATLVPTAATEGGALGRVSIEPVSIEPGATTTIPIEVARATGAGTVTLHLQDAAGAEAGTHTVRVEPPDVSLLMAGLDIRPRANLRDGDAVTVLGTVVNAGTDRVRNVTVAAFVNGATADVTTIPVLGPGEETVVALKIRIPGGAVSVGMVVDPSKVAEEGSSLDNAQAITIDVADGGLLSRGADVPGPAPMLALLLMAGAGLLGRRSGRRRD